MLKITVESSKSEEKCVGWLVDLLKYKRVSYKLRTAKKIGEGVVYMTVFEKK
jgi:hypothetical protein